MRDGLIDWPISAHMCVVLGTGSARKARRLELIDGVPCAR